MKAILRTTKAFKDWVLNLSPKARTQPDKKYHPHDDEPMVSGFVIEATLAGFQRSYGTQNMDKSGITSLDQTQYQDNGTKQKTYVQKTINQNANQEHENPRQPKNGEASSQPQQQKSCIEKLRIVELKNYFPQWQWYSKQTKLAKGTIVSAIIIVIGIIVGLVSWLTTRCWSDCQTKYSEGLIVYKNQQFLLTQGTHTDLNHDSRIILAQTKKAQSIDRSTESVLRTLWSSDGSQRWIFSVRIFVILENLSNSQKNQQIYKDWLEEYNKNPRKMIDLLLTTIKQTLGKPGTQKWGKKIPDNIALQSVIEQTLIDIRYDPFLEKFVLSTFQENGLQIIDFDEGKDRIYYKKEKENLRSQNKTAETSDKKGKKSDKNDLTNENNQTKSKQQLLARVMRETVYYIKRVAARNIQAIRAQSEKLMEYQKSIIDENRQLQKWEKTLIEDCKSIQMLKFRCRIEGAMELIPELTMEKLIEPGSTYLISENLEMVFKEIKTQQKVQGNQ